MSEILELRDVAVHFPVRSPVLRRTVGHVHAVDGVSLSLDRGETLGLVGESGSGKSTLGRVALGLLEASTGDAFVDGVSLASVDRRGRQAMRRRLQAVFQDPYSSLDPYTAVGDSVLEPLRTHRIGEGRADRRRRVAELFERVGLDPGAVERYPREFSGGQLQRIAIARALALDPELIVLDEPVSALDVSTQAEVINVLADLQAETGVAYLFIAHDLAVVDHFSSRVAVMYLGRIVEHGTTRAVVDAPKHPYTLALLSAVPGQDDSGRAGRERIILSGDLPAPTRRIEGCRFNTRCPFVMDVCRSEDPEPFAAPDGSVVSCHLHTSGPELGGAPVTELPIPEVEPALHTSA